MNETALAAALEQVARECAPLVIAHRYSTVRSADQVVVLDGGEVVAAGGHEELLDGRAYYRGLATVWREDADSVPVARRPTALSGARAASRRPGRTASFCGADAVRVRLPNACIARFCGVGAVTVPKRAVVVRI